MCQLARVKELSSLCFNFCFWLLNMRSFRESLWLVLMDSSSNAFQKQPPTGVLSKSCSENYAANLQGNTHAEV